jgi:hypothetical protein
MCGTVIAMGGTNTSCGRSILTRANILAAATAAIALSLLSFNGAGALPVAPLAPAAGTPEIILVEGGCGPGFHRNEFGRCRPNAVVVVPGVPVVVAPPVVVVPAPVVCGAGFRWHPRFRRCVVL